MPSLILLLDFIFILEQFHPSLDNDYLHLLDFYLRLASDAVAARVIKLE